MIIYFLGNIATRKTTYAKYIMELYGGLLMDDDDIYYTISGHTWDKYWSPEIQDTVNQMLYGAVVAYNYGLSGRGRQVDHLIFASASIDLYKILELIPKDQVLVIYTGMGNKTAVELARSGEDSRGRPIKEWIGVLKKFKNKLQGQLTGKNKDYKSTVKVTDMLPKR